MKRYVLDSDKETVEEVFEAYTDNKALFEPNYNVVPGNAMPIIVREDEKNEIVSSIWGLKLAGTDESIPELGYKEVEKQGKLKVMAESTPCIIPASGFYKWKETVEDPLPFYLRVLNQDVSGIAGLYNIFTDDNGREVHSYLVLTMPANPLVEPLDDTMPVILKPENYVKWLSGNALDMIKEGFSGNYLLPNMSVFRVPELVNDPSNNSKELIQPIPKLRNYDGEEE